MFCLSAKQGKQSFSTENTASINKRLTAENTIYGSEVFLFSTERFLYIALLLPAKRLRHSCYETREKGSGHKQMDSW
jgi:hypothetical protein